MSNPPVKPRDASTVLLVRDAPEGLEVFMVVRHPNIKFAAGALVFPGGAVDPCDRIGSIRDLVPAATRGLDDKELAWRVAAVREVYEECGVLLARARGESTFVDAERVADIDARFQEDLSNHRLDLVALAVSEKLDLACDALIPFGHWVTPASRPKRFDTRFYIAGAPRDQRARHDGHESVDSLWGRPDSICAEADAGKWHLRFPTRMNLEKLAGSADVEQALAMAADTEVIKILAEAEPVDGGSKVRIPREAGYGITEAIIDDRGMVVSRK